MTLILPSDIPDDIPDDLSLGDIGHAHGSTWMFGVIHFGRL